MTLATGARFGSYEIRGLLGTGGMGEVYRARDSKLAREVAIKVLPPELSSDTRRLQRFEKEARIVSALNHPNVVTVYDVGACEGSSFIAMELVEGKTLREVLDDGAVPLRKLLPIGAQITDGLARAHASGIVHRDLKPENLMVTREGFVKILDFGLAKLARGDFEASRGVKNPTLTWETEAGMVLGTVGYMSPEQATGRPVDFRCDQFSFGSILYEMISGKRAFQRPTEAQTLSAIIEAEPEPLLRAAPKTPTNLVWIVERCLAKDPEDRYGSTKDLARDLKTVCERFSELSGSGPSAAIDAGPRRRLGWIAVPAAMLVGALAAAAWFRARAPKPQRAPVVRALTFTGRDYSPAVSPDGKTMAFVSDREGKMRIWLRQIRGGGEQPLTDGPLDDNPRFSPEGSSILFVRASRTAPPAIFRQNVVGGEARRVAENTISGDWSPDGRQIAFVRWELEGGEVFSSVWLVAPDGSGAREIYRGRDQVFSPRFSPDGTKIAMFSVPRGAVQPYFIIVGADGKLIGRIPGANIGAVSAAGWSGNDAFVYSQGLSAGGSNVGVPASIVFHDMKTGTSEVLLSVPTHGSTTEVVADGQVLFETASFRENLREIVMTGPKAGESRWLTRGQATDRQPAYSPDGEWIVFSSNRAGNLDLWEISPKTGVIRRVTDDAAEDWDPGFMPDGKLLWSSSRSGPFEIWSAEADGSNTRQLSHDGVNAENPTTTPDGAWIYYTSNNEKQPGLWRMRSDGSAASPVFRGRMDVPETSPDGRHVAFASLGDGTLKVIRVEDGSVVFSTSVAPTPGFVARQQAVLGRPRWMPGGRQVAFIGRDENGVNGVYVQDFVPGGNTDPSRRRLGGFDPDTIAETLAISADGSRLTVGTIEPVFGISIAENVPRVRKAR